MASLPKPEGLHVLEDITRDDDGFTVREFTKDDLSDPAIKDLITKLMDDLTKDGQPNEARRQAENAWMLTGTVTSQQDRVTGPGRALLLEHADANGHKTPYGLLLSSHSQYHFSNDSKLQTLRRAAEALSKDDPPTANVPCPLYDPRPQDSSFRPDHYILFCRTKDSMPADESDSKSETTTGETRVCETATETAPKQKPGLARLLKTLTQGGQYPVIRAHLDADELDPSAATTFAAYGFSEIGSRKYTSGPDKGKTYHAEFRHEAVPADAIAVFTDKDSERYGSLSSDTHRFWRTCSRGGVWISRRKHLGDIKEKSSAVLVRPLLDPSAPSITVRGGIQVGSRGGPVFTSTRGGPDAESTTTLRDALEAPVTFRGASTTATRGPALAFRGATLSAATASDNESE